MNKEQLTFDVVKTRYLKHFVTPAQLLQFKEKGVITEQQYLIIINNDYPVEDSGKDPNQGDVSLLERNHN